MKLVDLFMESIYGGRMGPLYHWTSFANLYKILKENYLKGSNRTVRDDVKTIDRKYEYGVSLTRDKRFHSNLGKYYPTEVCMVIDGDKLSNNYKLFPYNDFFEGPDKPTYKSAKESDEMETRTTKSIEKIKKYIVRVELYDNTSGASIQEQLDFIKFIASYYNVYKDFNYNGYTTIDEFKEELCQWVINQGVDCVIK